MAKIRKRLGELVLRNENPQALVEFYRDILQLELFATLGTATFLKIDNDFEGHPQLLALFEKSHSFSGPKDLRPEVANANAGTLHHFAFAMDKDDFDLEMNRLQGLGIEIQLTEHSRFGWQSIYMFDPDGNSVEFVCYDSDTLDSSLKKGHHQ